MALSTAISYLGGLGLLKWQDDRRRRLCLILPITADLLLLAYFKYSGLMLETIAHAAKLLHWSLAVPSIRVILPVGISFYTFHTITYIVDSYRRTIKPTSNLFEFSCYVSLFSQLVAGPIVRFRQIEKDLENIDNAKPRQFWDIGWSFFAIGMIEKVLLADTMAKIINPALKSYGDLSSISAWLCILGYTYQLYFDFLGYSDMAVGLGYLFGIHIPQNFNSPYKASDISDFWRRWHISLSSCLRDYLYIPLGGNRGSVWFANRNLMLTMIIGGLWHGANWTFVLWGFYHGVLLALHRQFRQTWQKMPLIFRQAVTFGLVMVGWVLFRSDSFDMAASWLRKLFFWQNGLEMPGRFTLIMLLVVAAIFAQKLPNSFEIKHEWNALEVTFLGILFSLALFVIYGGSPTPFLYFQF